MDTQTPETVESYLTSLNRRDLQAYAKQYQIKANGRTQDIIDGLLACYMEQHGTSSCGNEANGDEEEVVENVIPLDDSMESVSHSLGSVNPFASPEPTKRRRSNEGVAVKLINMNDSTMQMDTSVDQGVSMVLSPPQRVINRADRRRSTMFVSPTNHNNTKHLDNANTPSISQLRAKTISPELVRTLPCSNDIRRLSSVLQVTEWNKSIETREKELEQAIAKEMQQRDEDEAIMVAMLQNEQYNITNKNNNNKHNNDDGNYQEERIDILMHSARRQSMRKRRTSVLPVNGNGKNCEETICTNLFHDTNHNILDETNTMEDHIVAILIEQEVNVDNSNKNSNVEENDQIAPAPSSAADTRTSSVQLPSMSIPVKQPVYKTVTKSVHSNPHHTKSTNMTMQKKSPNNITSTITMTKKPVTKVQRSMTKSVIPPTNDTPIVKKNTVLGSITTNTVKPINTHFETKAELAKNNSMLTKKPVKVPRVATLVTKPKVAPVSNTKPDMKF